MFRYVALVWQRNEQEQCSLVQAALLRLTETDSAWTVGLESPGLEVLCIRDRNAPDDVLRLSDGSGVILGTLFERRADTGSLRPVKTLCPADLARLTQSSGRSLVKSHWGSYVLFLNERGGQGTLVFRGPVGRLACFMTEVRGITIFFARPDDLLALRLVRPSINWDLIRAQAVGADYLTPETALAGVTALLPGGTLNLSSSGMTQGEYWSPRLCAPTQQVHTLSEAGQLLEACTRQCVGSWASSHDSVLIALSGGFDSSVVLGYLRTVSHPLQVVAVNFFDLSAADERRFARSSAHKWGVPLLEKEYDRCADFRRFLDCTLTATPVLNFTALEAEPTCIRVSAEHGASAVFTGELGDDIFGRAIGPEVLADCLWRYGMGVHLVSAAADYAQFKRLSVLKAISIALRYRALQNRARLWSMYLYQKEFASATLMDAQRLVAQDVLAWYDRSLPRFIHPWFLNVDGVPPGWFQLLDGLIRTTSTAYQSPFGGTNDALFVHPLVSQPLVEAYMSIPANLHISGGHSGAVARRSFSDILTTEVIARGRSKGTPEIWLIDMVQRNRDFLLEFLLDGVLVREGILDRGKVEGTLSRDPGRGKAYVSNVFIQLYIEGWLRRWSAVEFRAAA